MRAYPKSSIVTRNQAFTGEQMPQKVLPMVSRGNVSLTAERRHLSLIVYAVPGERLRRLQRVQTPLAVERGGEDAAVFP